MAVDLAPCSYPRHRASDWVTETGPITCGVCHPPVPGVMFVERGDPPFEDLAVAAAARVGPPLPRCNECRAILWSGTPGLCGGCTKRASIAARVA